MPITLTKSVQTVTGQPDVDQVVLDEAIKNRSGMPVESELMRQNVKQRRTHNPPFLFARPYQSGIITNKTYPTSDAHNSIGIE